MGAEGLLGRAPPGPTPECLRLAGEGLSCPWTSAQPQPIKGWGRSKGGDGTRDPGPLPGFLASFLGLGSLSLDAGLSGE